MAHRFRTLGALALAAGLGLAAFMGASGEAQAHSRGFSFYGGSGGFSLHIGPGYGYYPYRRHYYRPYYYRPYYYAPRPYYYKKRYYKKRRYGRCHYKARKCARNWGWHNHNWRGCMRYHGCR